MSNSYLGEIRLYGFSYAPRGQVVADGRTLSIQQYSALYALYGITYGGDGRQNFGIPDLRGRTAVGMGQRTGGANYTLGQQAGSENATLNSSNLPAHVHTFSGTLNAMQAKASAQSPDAGSMLARGVDENGTDNPQIYVPAGTSGTQVALAGVSGTTNPAGNGAAFSVLQPLLALNYSVVLQGLYPSRN